jgi:hypothetical protein
VHAGKLRTLLVANGVVGVGAGVGLLLVPAPLLRAFGFSPSTTADLVARSMGVEFIGYNLVTWLAARDPLGATSRTLITGHSISEPLGFAVSLIAVLRGQGNGLAWSFVVLYLAFAVLYLAAVGSLRQARARSA